MWKFKVGGWEAGKGEHFKPRGICDTCLAQTLVTSPFIFYSNTFCNVIFIHFYTFSLLSVSVGLMLPFFESCFLPNNQSLSIWAGNEMSGDVFGGEMPFLLCNV